MEYNLNEPIAERKTKTVYRDGNKTIKLFIENYSKAAILNEALIQARVEEKTDLNMSRLLEVTKIENRWALVTEFIEGTPLDVAKYYRDVVIASMNKLREIVDAIEPNVSKDDWPLPTYGDLIFKI